MKIYEKLLVIALIFAMIFSISAVAAAENFNSSSSDLTQVPHEQVVSVAEPTVQEVETIDLETSEGGQSEDNVVSPTSDQIINGTDSQVESFKQTSKRKSLLGASNNEDVLGANTITPTNQKFSDIGDAVVKADTNDIIDLAGKTYYGTNSGNLAINKQVTIQNGIIDGKDIINGKQINFEKVSLKNVTFINFHFTNGKWTRVFSFSNSTLENVKFINSSQDRYMAMFSGLYRVNAVNVSYDGITSGTCVADIKYSNLTNVNFTNSRVTDNTKENDTGQFTVMINSKLDNCNFINTSSQQHSGAICMARGENTVINSNFINCTAWVGGAIYAHGDFAEGNQKYTIENCKFINCHAEEEGGALGLSHNNMDVKNCEFINNTATKGAGIMVGGIYHPDGMDGDNSHGHNITIEDCVFKKNVASEEGGAVHISGDNNTFINSQFYDNEAPEGGAVHITGNNASAVDSIFDDNFAHGGKGAAIYVKGDDAALHNSKFTRHESEMGTVYIEGNHFNCTDSVFTDNVAEHGGAGIYVEGDYSYVDNSHFENNNASRHGGAIHSIGSHAKIYNSEFRNNNAIPSSSNQDYGLGGAIYINGRENEVSYSKFKYNTARNGSAIYNNGDDLVLNDDTFEDNQAWSYFLFTEAKPPESYWGDDMEVAVNVTLVAGDNLINAIYNNRTVYDVYFHNVTYTLNPTEHYPTGIRTTTDQEIHPVNGVENSQDGKVLYQDAREDNQVVNVNVTYKDGLVYEYHGKTNRYGNVYIPLRKENMSDGQFHPGTYTVTAEHPDDAIYTSISNSTNFTIYPHVDVSVTKTSDKDVYFVGENAVFTIRVYGVGTNATNVKVTDFLPKSFKFVDAHATQGTYNNITNVWDVGFLPHEASHTLTLTIQTTELGTFDNVVNVTCTEKDWNLSNNVDNKTIHVDLYYTKQANVTNTSAGEYIEYYLRVYNIGNSDYTDVVRVRDVLPKGIRYANEYKLEGADLVKHLGYPDEQIWDITNIFAGTHAKITIKALALEDGVWNNTLQVWDYPPVNATVNVTSSADLQVKKSASVQRVNKGDIINWTISVINYGPSIAFNAYVDDILPNGLEIIGFPTYKKGQYVEKTGRWTIGNMAVGETQTFVVTTRVTITGKNITNVAVVNSTTPDPDPTNNEDNDTVEFNPDIVIEKLVSSQKTYHGDVISWTILVTNNGPNDAHNVYVIDKLPSGLVYKNSTATIGSYIPTTGRWIIGTLEEGKSANLTINTEVTARYGFITNNATVFADDDSNPNNNYAENFTQVRTEADVGIVKLVSNQISHYGDDIVWTVVVTNHGPNTAENVVVIDFLPVNDLIQTKEPFKTKGQLSHQGITGRWDIGNLAPNETVYCEIYTKVLSTNKTIINVVTVTSDTYDPNLSNNRAENGTYVPPEADVAVVKSVNNSTPNKYDNVIWTITILNNGPNAAENVAVKDILPSGLKYVSNSAPTIGTYSGSTNIWTIGTLEVGKRHSLQITTTVIDTGLITNEVNATTSTYDTNLENNYDNETIDVPAIADLVITKEVSNKTSKYGELVNWTITVTNNGPNNARNVVINDKLPNGLIYVTHNASKGLYDSVHGIWQIGDLLHLKTEKIVITTRVNITNATITNVAVVTSTTPDSNETNNKANNTTTVGPVADLAVVKVVNNHGPKKGDEIVWTITVTNNGPDVAVNAVAKDVIPNGLIYVSSSGDGTYDTNTKLWTIGDIENKGVRVLNITTKVDVTKAVITNVVNVTSETPDPDFTNNEDNATIDVGHETDLEVIKTVSNSTPKYGDEIIWNITVINHGPDDAIETVVTDKLPNGLVWISDDSNGKYNPITGIWNIGTLPYGNNVTLLIKTLVNASGVNITNVAVVTTDTHDTNESNNKDNDTIKVPEDPKADLQIVKIVSNKNPHKGDVITWTITVTNNGPDAAYNVTVTDKLPSGLIYQNDDSKGKYNPTTGIWEIGTLLNKEPRTLVITTVVNITNATITNVAVVNSTTPDTNESNNKANNTTNVDPVADLEIIKLVSASTAKKGDVITWTITVTNNGPDVAVNTRVTDKLPAGLIYNGHKADGLYDPEQGVWIVGDLAKGESKSLVIKTIVNINNGTIENVAVVTSDTPDNNTDNNKANNTTDVENKADLVVVKVVSNKNPKFGETITWTITVTNNGPDTAVNTKVTDKLPAGLIFKGANGDYNEDTGVWTVGNLANGESKSLVITTVVNVTNATIENVAVPSSDTPGNRTPGNNTTDVDPVANLNVVKVVSNKNPKFGETITWTITVINNGPDTAVNTRVTDKLPAGLIFKGANGDYNEDTGVWTVGDLANGESRSLVITTVVNVTNATIENVAVPSSDTPGNRTPGNNTTDVDPEADLEIIKLVSDKNSNKGDIITWTIVVTNKGSDVAENVYVIDELPTGLVYRAHNPSKGLFDPNSMTWYIKSLAKGESATLTVNTLVNASNMVLINKVNVTNDVYDPNKTNNKANNNTTVGQDLPADLKVVKVVSDANPHRGDVISWTITVTNDGPGTAKDVTVTDNLPDGLIFNGADGDYNKDTGVWTVGDLANGESKTLVISTIVITNAKITNVAVANSTTPDTNETNNKDNDTTVACPEADLKVTKTVSNPRPTQGDTVTWTIVVTNLGPDMAKDVSVVETLPEGLKLLSAKGTKGSFDNGIWTVGDLDNGEIVTLVLTTKVTVSGGTIENIVVANSSTYDPNITNNMDKEVAKPQPKVVPKPSADLEIIKEANVDKVKVGDKIIWTITVINYGPDKAENVVVTDLIKEGKLLFISAKVTKGIFNAYDGTWNIGDLENGDQAVLILVCEALSEGTVINYANVTSDTPDPDLSNNEDISIVEVEKTPENNDSPQDPDTPNDTPEKTPTMHATGNPIVMVLLALLSIVGVTLRRRN